MALPTTAFEESPVASVAQSHILTQEAFAGWWGHIDATDRDEFRYVYSGDELLARFVCALDALMLAGNGEDEESLLALAYFVAARPYPAYQLAKDDSNLLTRAHAAWKHDAVQALIERVRFRSTKRRRARLENLVYSEAERMVEDAQARTPEGLPVYSMQDRGYALTAATRLMKMVDEEEAVVRAERSRRGLSRARESLEVQSHDDNPRVLKMMVKAIAKKLGTETVRSLLGAPGEVIEAEPVDG